MKNIRREEYPFSLSSADDNECRTLGREGGAYVGTISVLLRKKSGYTIFNLVAFEFGQVDRELLFDTHKKAYKTRGSSFSLASRVLRSIVVSFLSYWAE